MNPSNPDDEPDTILLHGVPLTDESNSIASSESRSAETPSESLILRPFDDGVPGRDYQPRLFRFGEAA